MPEEWSHFLSGARNWGVWKGGSWSCWGSNPGPSPYQSDALPTELHDPWGLRADVPKWLRGSPAKRVCSACAGSNPAVCVFPTVGV